MRPRGQVVKTPPFHGGITGSTPVGVIIEVHTAILSFKFLFGEEKVWVRIPVGKEQPMV